MSRIPLPERGQPIDLSYIYQIAEAINDISQQLSPTNNRYVTIDTPADGKQSTMSSGVKINAAYLEVYTGLPGSSTGKEEPFSYNFPADYKYAPVAVATPVNIGNTTAGKDVSVIIRSVTTSRVEGSVIIASGGEATVGVNLIIVGIPN
jgi:hypothetical protein